ncbi:hypothetical protein E2C01_056940 [Portunus trituberculatus]|uniref:Uncharacterized protein n=1 Tax=Portunus trituberculatus TaxID=210409 RepID=A0A5B7GS68_PORTR|nr:hypothetical protein [Portunus trituberculatus]
MAGFHLFPRLCFYSIPINQFGRCSRCLKRRLIGLLSPARREEPRERHLSVLKAPTRIQYSLRVSPAPATPPSRPRLPSRRLRTAVICLPS